MPHGFLGVAREPYQAHLSPMSHRLSWIYIVDWNGLLDLRALGALVPGGVP